MGKANKEVEVKCQGTHHRRAGDSAKAEAPAPPERHDSAKAETKRTGSVETPERHAYCRKGCKSEAAKSDKEV